MECTTRCRTNSAPASGKVHFRPSAVEEGGWAMGFRGVYDGFFLYCDFLLDFGFVELIKFIILLNFMICLH